VRQGLNL